MMTTSAANLLNPPRKSLLLRMASRFVARQLMKSECALFEMGWVNRSPMMVSRSAIAQVILAHVGGFKVSQYDLETRRFTP